MTVPTPQQQYLIGICLLILAGAAIGDGDWPVILIMFLAGLWLCLRNRGQM